MAAARTTVPLPIAWKIDGAANAPHYLGAGAEFPSEGHMAAALRTEVPLSIAWRAGGESSAHPLAVALA